MNTAAELFQALLSAPGAPSVIIGDGRTINKHQLFMSAMAASALFPRASRPENIALALDAGVELYVGALAALASNRAFFLLGPDQPLSRAQSLLRNSGCRTIIVGTSTFESQSEYWTSLADDIGVGLTLVSPQLEFRQVSDASTALPMLLPESVGPGEIAYIVPTSGSTATPRPVAVATAGLYRYSTWFASEFTLDSVDRMLFTPHTAFDMTVNLLVPSLLAGSQVVIPDRSLLLSPRLMASLVREASITFLNWTPSVLDLIGRTASFLADGNCLFPSLRTVMFGGDTLSAETARRWRRLAPNAALINCYGVAEATVTSFFHRISESDLISSAPIPIGLPSRGTSFLIDTDYPGSGTSSGRLLLRGELVAAGYIGSDEQGGFRKSEIGEREFLTQDVVSKDIGGVVHFVGRSDDMVKVGGGFRVGLPEIEGQLASLEPELKWAATQVEGPSGGSALVAVCEAPEINALGLGSIRNRLNARLPSYMRIARVQSVRAIPLTANGKVDRATLASLVKGSPQRIVSGAHTASDLVHRVWRRHLGAAAELDQAATLFELGGSSLTLIAMLADLEKATGRTLDPVAFLGEPTRIAHSRLVEAATHTPPITAHSLTCRPNLPSRVSVPIVRVAALLPSCDTADALAELLRLGSVVTGPMAKERANRLTDPEDATPSLPVGLFFSAAELDHYSASIHVGERERIDPQQLIWAACCEQLVRGIPPEVLRGIRVGVFAGYGPTFFRGGPVRANSAPDISGLIGTTPSFAPGRVAHPLNLDGPNFTVDSACSSSLLAVHLACESIRSGEVDVAIAGGVQVFSSHKSFALLREAGILSPTDRCRPFDDAANGYVPAEGAAAVLIARDASMFGDSAPPAWIWNSSCTHDGRTPSPSTPNVARQESLYRRLLEPLGLTPSQVTFIEAHGTGTPLGDPVECEGLRRVFGEQRELPLRIGSIKANIGHAHYAAGALGLLKAVLQIRDGITYRNPSLVKPNSRFGLGLRTFDFCFDNQSLDLGPSNCGLVSSFGFSGTNVGLLIGSSTHGAQPLQHPDESPAASAMPTLDDVSCLIVSEIAGMAKCEEEAISVDMHPVDFGIDSIGCLEIADRIRERFGTAIPATLLLTSGNIDEAAKAVRLAIGSHREDGPRTFVNIDTSDSQTVSRGDSLQSASDLQGVIDLCHAQLHLLQSLTTSRSQMQVAAGVFESQHRTLETVTGRSAHRRVDLTAAIRNKLSLLSCIEPIRITADTLLREDLGLTSLTLVELVAFIESLTPDKANTPDLSGMLTVGDLLLAYGEHK